MVGTAQLRLPTLRFAEMLPSLVPGEQQVREAIIGKARDRQHQRIAEQFRQETFARRDPPDRDRDIGADDEFAVFVGRVQAATHVVERSAIVATADERLRLLVDVLEGDAADANRRNELVALPVDATVADGAVRIVPDNKATPGHDFPFEMRIFWGDDPPEVMAGLQPAIDVR